LWVRSSASDLEGTGGSLDTDGIVEDTAAEEFFALDLLVGVALVAILTLLTEVVLALGAVEAVLEDFDAAAVLSRAAWDRFLLEWELDFYWTFLLLLLFLFFFLLLLLVFDRVFLWRRAVIELYVLGLDG
jgi:hypothetical protein